MNALIYTVHTMNSKEKVDSAILEILRVIETNDGVTQRGMAEKLDVALGLANSYLKRCVHKGLVKIHQAPANRYLYYLTPKGFAEKSRLTTEYLSSSFNFYRHASASCEAIVKRCHGLKYNELLLCGVSELAEIVSIQASEQDITIIGTLDKKTKRTRFLGLPVWDSFEFPSEFDACVVTELKETQAMIDYISGYVKTEILFIPDILGIKKDT